jgi:Ca2+-transporting ATPase
MLVTAVGVQSSGGKIQEMLNEAQDEMTPLQEKLKDVAILIGKIGVFAGIITFVGLAIRWAFDIVNNIPVEHVGCGDRVIDGSSILARVSSIVESFVVAITVVGTHNLIFSRCCPRRFATGCYTSFVTINVQNDAR